MFLEHQLLISLTQKDSGHEEERNEEIKSLFERQKKSERLLNLNQQLYYLPILNENGLTPLIIINRISEQPKEVTSDIPVRVSKTKYMMFLRLRRFLDIDSNDCLISSKTP
jgi:hypothetical protein